MKLTPLGIVVLLAAALIAFASTVQIYVFWRARKDSLHEKLTLEVTQKCSDIQANVQKFEQTIAGYYLQYPNDHVGFSGSPFSYESDDLQQHMATFTALLPILDTNQETIALLSPDKLNKEINAFNRVSNSGYIKTILEQTRKYQTALAVGCLQMVRDQLSR